MKFKDNHSKIVKKFIDLIGYEKMKSLSIIESSPKNNE
jgi:hypothetical protein